MEQATLRKRLFRLIIALKLAMWAAIAVALVTGIIDVAQGRDTGPPMALIYAIVALIVAQVIAILVWLRTGRRK
jgi:hypothetical protein